MNKKSAKTMNDIGTIYMKGMSEQIMLHFETILESRLSQTETLARDAVPSNAQKYDKICALLKHNVSASGFDRLAFCDEDGTFRTIFGDSVSAVDSLSFLNAIQDEEEKIVMGTDMNGNGMVLTSVPISLRMPDSKKSIALVSGFSVDYIADIFSQKLDRSMFYFIVERDGSIVIQGDAD